MPTVGRLFPFYRTQARHCRVESMQLEKSNQQNRIPEHLRSLAHLHPDYSLIELEESRAQLYRYFDLAWGIFLKLEQAGKLDDVLTKLRHSPTVKATKVEPK